MLMLGRRPGEEIILRDSNNNYIGRIAIGGVQHTSGSPVVRVALDFPTSIKINRREVDELTHPQPPRHIGISAITKAASPRIPTPRREVIEPRAAIAARIKATVAKSGGAA